MKQLITLLLIAWTNLTYAQTTRVNDEICLTPDVTAEYPGGKVALNKYLLSKFYSTPNIKIVNEDEVILSLIVEKDGSFEITGFKKMSQECPACNEEFKRIVSTIERFKPAQKNGTAVRSNLDIHLSLFDARKLEKTTAHDVFQGVQPKVKVVSDDEIHFFLDEEPVFPGGQAEMIKFLASNIKYPAEAVKNNIEGRVTVRFVVENNGELTDIKVIKGMANCPECVKEAIRVVKEMPKWKPAKVNGKEVRSEYYLPIVFKL